MSHYNGCGCGGHMHNSCNSCTSHNEIQQAVNDALAFEKENLEQYENNAAQSATDAAKEAAKAAESASAAAQSQTNAETAAGTATQAASSVTETAAVLEETANSIKAAQNLLEEQVASVQTKPVYFEVSTPTSSLVLNETDTIFNVRSIYVSSARQAVNYGFTFDKATRTITLAEPITAEQIAETEEGYILVEVICDVFNSDDPTSFPISLASAIGASLIGTSRNKTVQEILDSMGPDLLAEFAASDGFKLIGKCPDVATLRTIEPTYSGQTIILEKYDADGVLLNAQLHHDPYDNVSADDGLSIFVTPGGARWKADLTHGYNVAFAGLKRDLSNLAECFNKVRDGIIDRIASNGRVNNILTKIMIPGVHFVTNYTITEPLIYPSIITVVAVNNVYIEPAVGQHFNPVQAGRNDLFTDKLTKAMFQAESGWQGASSKYLNQASARVILDSIGGVLTIRGPGYALEYTNDPDGKKDPIFDSNGNPTLDTTGLSIGNMTACDLDCRDVVAQNISIIGFNKAFVWGTYNTFICGLRNVYISRVYDGVTIPAGISNSGERMWYDNVTFGNVARHVFVGHSAGEHTLTNCSTDFAGGDLFYNTSASACNFAFLSGHIEGIQGYIASKEAPTSYSKALVYISEAVKYDPRRGTSDYRGITQMFSALTSTTNPEYGIGLFIEFNANITAFDGVAPKAEYPCYAGSPVNTGFDLRMKQRRAPGSRYLNTYGPGSKLIHSTIQPAATDVGNPITSADPLSTGSLFAAVVTGGATVSYGSASDQNDSIRVIKITLAATTDTVQLYLCNRARAASGRNPLWASCSVNVEGATGKANITPIMANYMGSEVVVNSSTIPTTYQVKNKLAAMTAGYATDMIAVKAAANRTEKFQAMPSSTVLGYWQGADFFVPGFLITGFTGTLILKAPSFWFETENGGY